MGYHADYYEEETRDYGFDMPDTRSTFWEDSICITISIVRVWEANEDSRDNESPVGFRANWRVQSEYIDSGDRDPGDPEPAGPRIADIDRTFPTEQEADAFVDATWPNAKMEVYYKDY